MSCLGNSLYAEYKKQNIDVVVIHPSAISNTNFYQHEDIKANGKKIFVIGDIESSIISVTPKQVVHKMLSRMGKVNQVDVGWASMGTNLLTKFGRNFQGWLWGTFFSMNDSIYGKNKKE